MVSLKEAALNYNPQRLILSLNKGKVAYVDDDDYYELSKYKWYALKKGKTYYAYTHPRKKEYPIAMHNAIIGNHGMKKIVDHKDRNGLNNQKNNLRLCSHSQNKINANLFSNNKSGFSGVTWDKERNKWSARIKHNNKMINLGRYNTKEEAINARNKKGIELFGEFYNNQCKEVTS